MNQFVFLTGFMGSGKSHLAKKLSTISDIEIIDLDEVLEKKHGMRIAQIFSEQGENAFRVMESQALHQLVDSLADKGNSRIYVISCGGGTPCFHNNMDWMNEKGLTIWLNPSEEVLMSRLQNEKAHRPLIASLKERDLRQFISTKLKEREPFYSKAKLTLRDSNPSIDSILNSIQHA